MTINITNPNTNKKEIKRRGFFKGYLYEVLLPVFTFSLTIMAQVIYTVSIEYQLLGNYHCFP